MSLAFFFIVKRNEATIDPSKDQHGVALPEPRVMVRGTADRYHLILALSADIYACEYRRVSAPVRGRDMARLSGNIGAARVFAAAEYAACNCWNTAVSGPAFCGVGGIAYWDFIVVEHDLFLFGIPWVQ